MKDTKSLRVDGFPPKLLMETVEEIRITIARVFKLKKVRKISQIITDQ